MNYNIKNTNININSITFAIALNDQPKECTYQEYFHLFKVEIKNDTQANAIVLAY